MYNLFSDDSYSNRSKFYSFKEISMINVISLVPSCPISITRLIQRVFAQNEQILQKEAFCPAKRIFVFKIYFYKSFINM